MNIISIDLPWNPDKKGRRAVAVADLNGNIRIMLADNDDEMLRLIRENTQRNSLILLDVPIDGLDELDSKHFRPVDKALAHQGIWIRPSSSAGKRGKELKERLEKDIKRVKVQEIYPYAIYKFLAYLKDRRLLQRLKADKFDTLLDEGFRVYLPPKYKRGERRRENMKYLYSLLTDPGLGLSFLPPLPSPDDFGNLDRLSDQYDACLGAVVGLYYATNSPYARIAGDSASGNMLILADRWLVGRLGREVPID